MKFSSENEIIMKVSSVQARMKIFKIWVLRETKGRAKTKTPNMTGRGLHRTMEVPLARPWQSKTFFVSNPMKINTNKGMRGARARCDAILPPNISIVRHPGRPVISGMEKRKIHMNFAHFCEFWCFFFRKTSTIHIELLFGMPP